MSKLLLVDFGASPVGTVVPKDFTTSEGLRVVLPAPSSIEHDGPGTGIRVNTSVAFLPRVPFEEVRIRGFAGASPPTLTLTDPNGAIVFSLPVVKLPDHTIDPGVGGLGPIGRIDLVYPNGEGNVYILAAII